MEAGRDAFSDIKVLEFAWIMAGPFVGKYLADHGATVVRVESPRRPDAIRVQTPYLDNKPGVDRAGHFAHWNANRYSVALDLGHPRGIELAKKLVAWADVLTENFSLGVMEKLGLGYDELKKLKPDIIMYRSSNQGQTGPHRNFAATGIPLTALSGLCYYTGWPDQPPSPLPFAHSDSLSPRLGAVAILAALDYRARTGKGQCIDVSQFETSIPFLAPLALDFAANGRAGGRLGNSCPYASPHGVYRCKGNDSWCAIAVFYDEEWDALRNAMGRPAWSEEARFSTILGRKENESELNRLVEEWTSTLDARTVMTTLQVAGVAAGVVQNSRELCEDTQLKERGHFWTLKHNVIGDFPHAGQPFKLSKTPARGRMPSPCLGEHTEYVVTELLGLSDAEFIDLMNSGAFGFET